MDLKTAKSILEGRLTGKCAVFGHSTFSADRLSNLGWYLDVAAGDDEACLDGSFSADELEAIAVWMRDPKACCEA